MQATQNLARRTVILDIETASLNPANPAGALDAMTGRIVCIGLLFDDGQRLTPNPICDTDERKLLERFWAALRPDDVIVGHNVLGFDLMFIRQRSWILGVKPPIALNLRKYYTDQVVDLMELWTNWSSKFKGCGLENIARALGLGEKTAHGADVAGWWARQDFDSIVRYCIADCELAYRVYCRMVYREPIGAFVPTAAPMPQFEIPQRELVPVLVRPAVAMPAASAQAQPDDRPPVRVAGFAGAAPTFANRESRNARGRRNRQDKISYMEMGGALVLAGATFTLKEQLKAIGGRLSKNGEQQWIWQLPAGQFDSLAGLCARHNVQLVPAA